ncbi:MAG: hypothetical protein V4553_02250 [Bacteroidota bacterium]
MAIAGELINQIKYDFYSGPDHETLKIAEQHIDPFWTWFSSNSTFYKPLKDQTEFLNKEYLLGRCFGNSQTLTFETGLSYMEGFAWGNGRHIFHGFNLNANEVIDVTAANFPKEFEEYMGDAPRSYIGVEIPLTLINLHNTESIANKSKNIEHLIYRLFLEQSGLSMQR